MKIRWMCEECEWVGLHSDIDRVHDPKPGSDVEWSICPNCRAAERFINLCDEPGCNGKATCGWLSAEGYRRTCGPHYKPALEHTND